MIVDHDFPDHWKTRLLVGLLNDEAAPVYLLRLWGHCQRRKQHTFENLSAEALKALCRFPGHANKLESSLVTSGFIRRDAQTPIVVNWDEYNASLIAAWNNGRKGGAGSHKKRSGRKSRSNGPPTGEPLGSQTVNRLEESGEDQIREEIPPQSPPRGEMDFSELIPASLKTPEFEEAWKRFVRHRRQKKASLTKEAAKGQLRKLEKIGPERATSAVDYSIAQGWQGIFEETRNGARTDGPVERGPRIPHDEEAIRRDRELLSKAREKAVVNSQPELDEDPF